MFGTIKNLFKELNEIFERERTEVHARAGGLRPDQSSSLQQASDVVHCSLHRGK